MSSSADESDMLDLDVGLPCTPADSEAQRRLRPGPMSFQEYVRFLEALPQPTYEQLKKRPLTRGEPFKLD